MGIQSIVNHLCIWVGVFKTKFHHGRSCKGGERPLTPLPLWLRPWWIAGDNLVQWRFDNVEINYLNLSLTGILKLNFVAYFLLREKFETTPSLPKQQRK